MREERRRHLQHHVREECRVREERRRHLQHHVREECRVREEETAPPAAPRTGGVPRERGETAPPAAPPTGGERVSSREEEELAEGLRVGRTLRNDKHTRDNSESAGGEWGEGARGDGERGKGGGEERREGAVGRSGLNPKDRKSSIRASAPSSVTRSLQAAALLETSL